MAHVYFDRVLVTSSTTSTGTYTLGSAVTGYQSFSVMTDNDTCFYFAEDVDQTYGYPLGGWEVGVGTKSGSTLARTTILASSNAGAAVNWSTGTRRIGLSDGAYRNTNMPNVQIFQDNGTWTKPTGAKWVSFTAVGGGGGGGGGRQGASGTARGGGGGGGGGAYWPETKLPASSVGNALSVVVGDGGIYGLGASVINTNGEAGANGGDSYVSGTSTYLCFAAGGIGGGGGIVGAGVGGVGGSGVYSGGTGGNGYVSTVGANAILAAGGGGGGGGVSNAGNLAGSAGGTSFYTIMTNSTGGSAGTAPGLGTDGGNGANQPIQNAMGGQGGGGGGTGAYGGTGGLYGGGGGGGGGTTNGTTAGRGGHGGDGIVIIVSW